MNQVEFSARSNRSGAGGFYIHVGTDNIDLMRAICDYARIAGDTGLVELIESFAVAQGIAAESLAASVPPKKVDTDDSIHHAKTPVHAHAKGSKK